jgi:hypothetical protein
MATGSYVDERDDWRHAVERARRERWPFLELTAIAEPRLGLLEPFLASHSGLLESFQRVSLHAPVSTGSPAATINCIANLPLASDVIFHPDGWGDERGLDRLGLRVVFENMDVVKRFGRSVGDLQTVFATHPEAGFCLDVAHVWTNDRTLRLGHELLDAFGDRLRQLHVSVRHPCVRHRSPRTSTGCLTPFAPQFEFVARGCQLSARCRAARAASCHG